MHCLELVGFGEMRALLWEVWYHWVGHDGEFPVVKHLGTYWGETNSLGFNYRRSYDLTGTRIGVLGLDSSAGKRIRSPEVSRLQIGHQVNPADLQGPAN